MNTTDSTTVVDYFSRLSRAEGERSPVEVVKELAALLSASALGLENQNGDGESVVYSTSPAAHLPWRTDLALLQRVRTCWTACTHANGEGEWLVSLVSEPGGEGRLVWGYRPGKGAWPESDQVLWMFAAHALVRWLHQAGAETAAQRRRIENAAMVTGRLCHDFGNYLTGIMGFTELSLSHAPVDSTLHRYLGEVLDSAKQGADWLRRLHVFSRRGAVPIWPTHLTSMLTQEEARLRAAGHLGMQWQAKLPAELPLLAIDADALQAAVAEIVANARDAAKDQGTISITARTVELSAADCRCLLGTASFGPFVEISISDDGPGMSAEQRAKLLSEVFFSTKSRHRGLGLLVVYGIMHRCGGGIRIEPAPAGTGICVKLFVPRAAIDASPIAAGSEAPHILVVHGDPLLTSSMRDLLQARGCRVSVASNPHAALTVCRAKGASVAAVVTDLMLPHLGGLDLARRILEHDPKICFVFLLAQASFHGLREEDLLKRFDLLRWPTEPSAFFAAIQSALARS